MNQFTTNTECYVIVRRKLCMDKFLAKPALQQHRNLAVLETDFTKPPKIILVLKIE